MAKRPKTKRCSHCGIRKKLSCFYKDRSSKDGCNHRCGKCDRLRNQEYSKSKKGKAAIQRYQKSKAGKAAARRHTQSEKRKANQRRYAKSKTGKAKKRIADKKTYLKHRQRHRARAVARYAFEKGILQRPSECSINNSRCKGQIEMHHVNYEKPLKVNWFCSHHHDLADAKLRRKEEAVHARKQNH